jgi:LPXTG-site transpeptidase (sortase) family protein
MKSFTRLLQAFVIFTVAAYTFINGPTIYANMRYWAASISPQEDEKTVASPNSSKLAVIKPVLLPVSDFVERPLPDNAKLIIQKLGVSTPIVFGIASETQKIYDQLTNGVVHYSVTPKPGKGGAAVLLGHSSLYAWQVSKVGSPFALLSKLQPGDLITVRYEDGREFKYRMTKSIVFNPLESEGNTQLEEIEQSTKPIIILVTCWPTGQSSKRLAVQAKLAE